MWKATTIANFYKVAQEAVWNYTSPWPKQPFTAINRQRIWSEFKWQYCPLLHFPPPSTSEISDLRPLDGSKNLVFTLPLVLSSTRASGLAGWGWRVLAGLLVWQDGEWTWWKTTLESRQAARTTDCRGPREKLSSPRLPPPHGVAPHVKTLHPHQKKETTRACKGVLHFFFHLPSHGTTSSLTALPTETNEQIKHSLFRLIPASSVGVIWTGLM